VYCKRDPRIGVSNMTEYHPIYTIVLPVEMALVLADWEEVLASEELVGGLRRYLIRSRKTAVA
jgi:hypothetical protein